MKKYNKEKRRFQRVFFSSEDCISGLFKLPKTYNGSAKATVMDISQDGIGITFKKNDCPTLNQGEHIVLIEILNMQSLSFMKNIEMSIRWVLSHKSLEHIALGCQFLNISDEIKQQLKQVINSWSIKIKI